RFGTGRVRHEWVLSAAAFEARNHAAYVWDYFNTQSTNLYQPVYSPLPAYSNSHMFTGNQLASPALIGTTALSSVAVGDTLSMFSEQLLLTLGARQQTLKVQSFAYDSHAGGTPYDQSRLSPVLGVVWKPVHGLSVYGNAIQGLSQGDSYTNGSGAQVTLAPYVSHQTEAGLKYDPGKMGFGLALFDTAKPRVLKFGQAAPQGEDRHRGAEFN